MFEDLRNFQFPQMNLGTFADFGGSFPISQSSISRINAYSNDILSHYKLSGNISKNEQEVNEFKQKLLELFHTDESSYSIFFTSNCSAALKSLGFAFPWSKNSKFIYHIDNHNSVLGLRGIVAKRGGSVNAVGSFPKMDLDENSHSLFVFAPQSNFNGKKYPLNWIEKFHCLNKEKAHVLIDCSAYVPSCDLNLNNYKADFVVFSLLKMFGVNGGALIIKNDVINILDNLNGLSFDEMSILGAYRGLKVRQSFENSLGCVTISQHVYELAKELFNRLKEMKHYNGKNLVKLYPEEFNSIEEQGGTIAFNIFNSNGNPIPHDSIFTIACADSVFMRFGVHCNPGATYTALGWKPVDIEISTKKHEAACSLTASIINGIHVGCIRVSFGYVSNMRDVENLVSFFESHFVEKEPQKLIQPESFELEKAYIHPIKGCQGIEITTETYKFVRTGLIYDENWGIADEISTFLDRNSCPLLATLSIQIIDKSLVVKSIDGKTLTISLYDRPKGTKFTSSTVCHEKINGEIYDKRVNDWFSDVLGQKSVLVRLDATEMKPYRCYFTSSLEAVGCSNVEQLRPHFIFKSNIPFIEDSWVPKSKVKLGDDLVFEVSRQLPITKESMIDCLTGKETSNLLHSICLLHKNCSKPSFGIELIANFVPSKKNPKELHLHSLIH